MRREEKVERDRRRGAIPLFLAVLGGGCVATPLPTPPSANAEKMELIAVQSGQVRLRGVAGAIRPGGIRLRVTSPVDEVETAVDADGRFATDLDGRRTDVYVLEALRDAEAEFLVSLTGGAGDGVVVVDESDPADPGDDPAGGDDPADPNDPVDDPRGGNDPADNADPDAPLESCNGLDDDGDGLVDEGCDPANDMCRNDADCAEGLSCTNGACGG